MVWNILSYHVNVPTMEGDYSRFTQLPAELRRFAEMAHNL